MPDEKILIFDIETSPIIIPTFGLYGEKTGNHKDILQDWYIISCAWKWLGQKQMYATSVIDDEAAFKLDHTDDRGVVAAMHAVLDEADVIVGHNVAAFDWKKLNTRFIKHGLPPLAKKRVSDTYKTAKREFNFTSNRLDYIATYLGVGAKMETPKGLWLDVLKGSASAVKTMVRYNKMDVVITEKVYLALRAYDTSPVNRSIGKHNTACPKCGSEHIQARGYAVTTAGKFQRYQCQDCGGHFRGTQNVLTTKLSENGKPFVRTVAQ